MTTTLSDQVRKAIKGCGLSRYAISKQPGVSEAMLSKFMAKKNDLTLGTVNRMAPILGVRIVVDRPKSKVK